MNVVLYTTGCPRCKVLESKLESASVSYEKSSDFDKLEAEGFSAAPVLMVDDKVFDFKEAIDWVNQVN